MERGGGKLDLRSNDGVRWWVMVSVRFKKTDVEDVIKTKNREVDSSSRLRNVENIDGLGSNSFLPSPYGRGCSEV